ncbi:MAG: Fe-S cluster assembly ATPase SufC [Candidatus Chromulinivorax sp.]
MISIQNLSVDMQDKMILHTISLHIPLGKIHALMGQNGSGKSSLAYALMGMPLYQIQQGQIFFAGQDITAMSITDRSKLGIFLAFQQPLAIPGVTVFQFLKEIYLSSGQKKLNQKEFSEYVYIIFEQVGLDPSFLYRGLNDNFSGGEKKRFEVVQMLILKPKCLILDEIDAGLDVDALKSVGNAIAHYLQENTQVCCLVITHYSRILEYIKPEVVHIMHEGKIVHTGGSDLIATIEQNGYDIYGK